MDAATAASLADAIDKAIATGVLSVRHGDTQTTFRSLDEMIRVRDDLRQQGSNTARTRVRYLWQTGRGY